jgi:hypothetical protein
MEAASVEVKKKNKLLLLLLPVLAQLKKKIERFPDY